MNIITTMKTNSSTTTTTTTKAVIMYSCTLDSLVRNHRNHHPFYIIKTIGFIHCNL